MTPSICIVIPYFGQWPFWMPYFLQSCRTNADIDWLLYTDCGQPENCSPNVRVVAVSYPDYCERVGRTLHIDFHPEQSYKLCDIKPALGLIHAEELAGYDFWGFGDLDLVYGDLRAYFTVERLARFDLFSTHARRISGHLCLIRNTEEMRAAFMRVKHWQFKLESPEHLAFDESAFSKIFLRHKNSPSWVRWLAAKFDPWLKRAEFVEAYTTPNGKIPWTDGSRDYPAEWYWQDGKVSNSCRDGRLYPYFHFMVWKKGWPQQTLPIVTSLAERRLVFKAEVIEIA
ncbi:MAG: hypothetical protein CVU26_05090 [Betaproteobacteria bacterium HGW-Betaproteobacteria-2]|nr:MAG: hypothetical protein CVU26_05090 [Betaproteobacteria bacterium HGW-Betaproteobacteria-2]